MSRDASAGSAPAKSIEKRRPAIQVKDGVVDLNGPESPVTDEVVREFVARIQDERKQGFGFVPFIGAGFSSPAGGPLTREILPYLQRCICLGIGAVGGTPSVPGHRRRRVRLWNPRTDQWPVFNDPAVNHATSDWRKELFDHLTKGWTQEGGPSKDTSIRAEAFGAAHEWRTALLFLSRLHHQDDGIALGAPKREIIDACFREVLRNKVPALNHRMLAALAGALRLDLVLTTNFDDLLEMAFAAARGPLEVFDVSDTTPLPDWSALSSVRSLVKLHGGKYSLRADYSLDTLPDERDKNRFLEYLLSSEGRRQLADADNVEPLAFQNHLLMLGTVLEPRTEAFIEHAWARLEQTFRVFWVCYSKDDVKRATDLTNSFHRRKQLSDRARWKDWHGSTILRHTESGLLLLQLYQMIRRSLPPMLGMFPSVSRLTLPPLTPRKPSSFSANEGETVEKIEKLITSFFKPDQGSADRHNVVVVSSDTSAGGVTTLGGDVFRRLEQQYACLWLDMNDISSTDNLFEVLLESVRFRLGQEHWTPTYISDASVDHGRHDVAWLRQHVQRRRAAEMSRLTSSIQKRWVIFFNARETPGVNFEPRDTSRPNGWLDRYEAATQEQPSADRSNCVEPFVELVKCLSDAGCAVVLMCRENEKENEKGAAPPPLLSHLADRGILGTGSGACGNHVSLLPRSGSPFSVQSIVSNVKAWAERTNECQARQRMLHALVLMQRPRFVATLWDPEITECDLQNIEEAEGGLRWLDELEDEGLIRRKPGGFIWMHSRSREQLRDEFAQGLFGSTPSREAALHYALAKWYMKVLDVSLAPPAIFEAVHHLCRSTMPTKDDGVESWNSRAVDRMHAAAALVRSNAFLIQTRGYSRGSCRKLEFIRDRLTRDVAFEDDKDRQCVWPPSPQLQDAIRNLRLITTEVMRAVAREVGEDSKSYLRQSQWGQLRTERYSVRLEPTKHEHGLSERIRQRLMSGDPKPTEPGGTAKDIAEWARWWRWCGMLAIASRSFHRAEVTLDRAWGAAAGEQACLESSKPTIGAHPRTIDPSRVQQRQRVEMLRILELQVELALLRIDADARAKLNALVLDEQERVTLERELKEITELIDSGRRIAALVRAEDETFHSGATIRANWCEYRLIMYKSVCVSLSVQWRLRRKDSMAQEAMGLLSEAEATLRLSDTRRHRSDLALVELHRGDARLRQAEGFIIGKDDKGNDRTFRSGCDGWESAAVRDGVRPDEDADTMKNIRRVQALLKDSLRFLNRAEPVLLERRRNVWWTTWFFERKLRAIALSVWATVLDAGTPVPFLGAEAALPSEDTVADRLLDDAIRMIRVDSYRLVTILDAYASSAKALQARIEFDRENPPAGLDIRQRRMFEKLVNGMDEAKRVKRLRDGVKNPQDKVSDDVEAAITHMTKRVREAKDWISAQLHELAV
jgi:hypothetical protein